MSFFSQTPSGLALAGLAIGSTALYLADGPRSGSGPVYATPQQPDELAQVNDDTPPRRTWLPNGEVVPVLSKRGIGSLPAATVIEALEKAAKKHPNVLAVEQERNGVKTQRNYREYRADVLQAARALMSVGFERHDSAAILGFNSYPWFVALLGAIHAGGKGSGIYTTNGPEACKYIVDHCKARVIFVENEMQLRKFDSVIKDLPSVSALIIWEGKPSSNRVGDVPVYTFDEFMARGKDVEQKALDERMAGVRPGHAAVLIYTSGTTGPPKAVMISHDNITWTARSVYQTIPVLGSVHEHIVSYLPLSHIAGQILDVHAPIILCAFGDQPATVHIARPDALKGTLGDTLKAVRPTIMLGVPRVWEKIEEKMRELGKNNAGLKKILVDFAKGKGLAAFKEHQADGSGGTPAFLGLANKLVLSKVRIALGLDRCNFCFSGAAPISPVTLNFFGALGITIHQVYGESECTGPTTFEYGRLHKVSSVGPPMKGMEVRLDHVADRDKPGEGEILYRGRHIMMGYMNNEEKTVSTVDEEGWLHSGDVGRFDKHGLLYITGRIKELIITAGGENIAPVPIEDTIKENLPAISKAMMVGDKRKYNVVLITLKTKEDGEGGFTNTLIGEAASVSSAKTVEEAQKDETWRKYIQEGIDKYNKVAVSRAQRIQKFAILPGDFSVKNNELTPTLKLKRPIVSEHYADVIDNLYN